MNSIRPFKMHCVKDLAQHSSVSGQEQGDRRCDTDIVLENSQAEAYDLIDLYFTSFISRSTSFLNFAHT